jgi:phosphoglycerate kinase
MKLVNKNSILNKNVILRVDLNVPLGKDNKILSDFRLKSVLPTIKYCLKYCNKLIVISHLGRPGGKKNKELSMSPIAKKMCEILKRKVAFNSDNILKDDITNNLSKNKNKIIMLENLRFYKGEKSNDDRFAGKLASLGDVYVNDAFSVCHREHASVNAITKYLPVYIGKLLKKEVIKLTKISKKPEKPFVLVVGGVKVSDKIEPVKALGKKASKILLGGGVANTFLKAMGYKVGDSVIDKDSLRMVEDILQRFERKIVLPIDFVVSNCKYPLKNDYWSVKILQNLKIKKNEAIYDIGPKTSNLFCGHLKKSKSIFWAGPLGLFETKLFSKGTFEVINCVAKLKNYSVVAGGETVTALEKTKKIEKIWHVSTGGGAALKFVAEKSLPGLKLLKKDQKFSKK